MVENKETLQSKACDWCCNQATNSRYPLLNIGAGRFRDVDSDSSYGIPICSGCGGLGVKYDTEDFKSRTQKIYELRFKYCPVDPDEKEKLTTNDKLKYLTALEREVGELVNTYGTHEGTFADEIDQGCLTPTIESLKDLANRIEITRNTPAIGVALALREPSIAMVEGRYKAAEKGFLDAIQKYPESSFAQHDYAVFLAEGTNNYWKAAEHFIESTRLEPKKALHFFSTAKCLTALGIIGEAIFYLEKTKKQIDYSDFVKSHGDVNKSIKILKIILREKQSKSN